MIEPRVGADRAPQELRHARQSVLSRRRTLPRLQPERGRQPIVAGCSARSILLAELTEDDCVLREALPFLGIFLAADAERLRPDRSRVRLGAPRVRSRSLRVEIVSGGSLARIGPPVPRCIRRGEQSIRLGNRRRRDRLDPRRLVQRSGTRGAEGEQPQTLHRALRNAFRARASAAWSSGTNADMRTP